MYGSFRNIVSPCMNSDTVYTIASAMSFWDRYLAPGDVRQGHKAVESQLAKTEEQVVTALQPQQPPRLDAAGRARRQYGLLYGGIAFAALSVFVTRRAIARKLTSSNKLATASKSETQIAGGLDAAQALSYATLNVVAFGMAAVGAIANIFDVADIEDLRAGIRRGVGFDVYGGDDKADKELEAWVEEVLSRKDGSGLMKDGLAGRLAELEKLVKEKGLEETKK
ncbi:hypothetical protein AMS68_004747 [Peltaster fructicola]|uniref:Altered inheritance of mitochondria protein 11 n=1 Tax=Peltaster fructicola TaxID=286661 RepID=A0A6H0XXT2_9PEZI|nr:hypothetical protein AMS68_004747 [Peltaster fructicola]